MAGTIRAGIGGWTFEPWRGVFYPKGLRQADELAYAAERLTAIEVNGTYYSSQKPESFAKWAASAPDGFVFSLKASRFCTNRRVLAEAGPSIEKFLSQGLTELGDKLGPILWQFMATKKFDPDDFAAFLKLLPAGHDGLSLRHVVEVRHQSFVDPAFVALCREHGVAICLAHHAEFPQIADVTSSFVYARLMCGADEVETCYPPAEIDGWAERLKTFAAGGAPADLAYAAPDAPAPEADRDVFAFFISSGKVRAPAGAMALISSASR
ncbi:DUF72 domain-containing protein [Phenylobacterium sp.]|uniref:DUF72 domain-containing protein n=1 Tax=Phenylobacterium sp. TaxID=1871053 RepID=UPI0035B0E9E8